MTSAYNFQGPAIRVQQSTPVPQLPTSYSQASPMLATDNSRSWDIFGGSSFVGDHTLQPANQHSALQYSNHNLPTPSQTPTSDSFLSPSTYQTFPQQNSNYDNTMAAHFAYKQAMLDAEDDVPGYTHSSRQSVSSYGNNSPATPRTVVGDDFDEKLKIPNNDLIDGTSQEAYQQLYNQPAVPRLQTQLNPQHAKHLMPYRSVMAERLQAANIARSQSPTSSGSRAVSPFRNGSPLAPVHSSFGSPRQRLGPVSQARDQTSEAAVKAFALKNHSSHNQEAEPKTISPKDALLEYNESEEDSKMPLFPAEDDKYSQHFSVGDFNSVQQNFDATSEQSFNSMATSRPETWAEPRNFVQGYSTAPSQSTFSFAPPSIPGSVNVPHGNMFMTANAYRPTSMPMRQDSTPDFPAHLTSMESSMSESGGAAEMGGNTVSHNLQKPGPSAAASGTYSCTYHGCPLRFESPQKLQKHKREGHRQNPPSNVTTGVGSGMSAEELLARNSQAGPHKCERRNPTTGKPCNIMFSRPYDLTRHEDTIHNDRKQKVRCVLCVEEKTFSRNDALTRHMRVVHPEVDYPAKHRRRAHD